jgi:hypothetical protein
LRDICFQSKGEEGRKGRNEDRTEKQNVENGRRDKGEVIKIRLG